ncbi:hypothetical protein MEO39_27405, partial [Dolichospermum sp. ST_sed2]|nr:hypothetical protein [Dolichospermum sp. ST_sed2]
MNQADEWGTTYAGHFMISAEKKGYELPSGFKSAWVKYQTNLAQNFEVSKNKYYSYDEQQAYRLYVLALANQPVLSAMNRLLQLLHLCYQYYFR